MKNNKKLIIAIVAVISIIAVVVGGTYAYWTWTTAENQRTTVGFTVEGGGYANLEGGGSVTVQNLAPAACTNSTYAMKRRITLTYQNTQSQALPITGTLTVSNWTQPHTGTLDLSKLHYALTTGSAAADNCNTGTNRTLVAGGADSTFVTSGALINNATLVASAPANMTTEGSQTYYLWVWLDSTYTHENVGTTISDPMQDLSFTLTWSGVMG